MKQFDDVYIYPTLRKISSYLCKTPITPNMITLSQGIPNYFIIKMILDDVDDMKQINSFYGLIILRFILDCFDGALARKCKKASKFGKKFDSFMEIVFIWSILFAIQYKYDTPMYFNVFYILTIGQFKLYDIWGGSVVYLRSIFYLLIILGASQFTKYKLNNKGKKCDKRKTR
jgi:phosphatidylglycerophosphate synthase